MPISRVEYLKPVFDCLAALDKPDDTELLIITDGDEELEKKVDRRLDTVSFKKVQVISFGDSPREDIDSRRWRISEIHNKARKYVTGEYVFLTEDDTTYPPDTINRLLRAFKQSLHCRFAQGVELGRRKTPYVGAWMADDISNPNKISSLMPNSQASLQLIDAGGFYCALVDANEYSNHIFEPFDKQGKMGLSCDVNFGMSLRQEGYLCYMDWGVQCDHIGEKGSVNLGNTKPVQVIFEKRKGEWSGRTA